MSADRRRIPPRWLSRAADYSKISLTATGLLAVGRGDPGRRAALAGTALAQLTTRTLDRRARG